MVDNLPGQGLQLTSTLGADGVLRLELVGRRIDQPGDDEVAVRLEAVPINPSDLMTLFGPANPAKGRFGGTPARPEVTIPVSVDAAAPYAGRAGMPLEPGLAGAGTVVAA